MTEEERFQEIGRLTSQYNEIKQNIACIRHRLLNHHEKLNHVVTLLRIASHGDLSGLPKACAGVTWEALCKDADSFNKLEETKSQLEDLLHQAGMDKLI